MDKQEIKNLRIKGLTYREIGEKVGLTYQRVAQICQKVGLSPKREFVFSLDNIQEYRRRGLTFIEIGKIFNKTPQRVQQVFAGIKVPRTRWGKSKDYDRHQYHKKMTELGKDYKPIRLCRYCFMSTT